MFVTMHPYRENDPQDLEALPVLPIETKRTWQWLPANKLDIVGIGEQFDQQKFIGCYKPTKRIALRMYWQDILH